MSVKQPLDLDKEFGMLAALYCKVQAPLTVLQSRAGYYIGTINAETGINLSRESNCYWPTSDLAQHALDTKVWPQKQTP